jgi:hypothetical protein
MAINNRNKVRQVIINKDGSKKVVFHDKPTHAPHYANKKEIWDWVNKQPKPNSKKQIKLKKAANCENSHEYVMVERKQIADNLYVENWSCRVCNKALAA